MEGPSGNDVEIMTRTLQMEHKVFYFDLKENPRGQYLKISEKASGSRSTIIVPASGISTFVDLFRYYADGENADLSDKGVPLESSEVQIDTKVFHFDVGQNSRGRFLKVSEATRNRSTIIVPTGSADADGWAAFRDVLADIDEGQHSNAPDDNRSVNQQSGLVRCGVEEGSSAGVLPPFSGEVSGSLSKIIRAEQKKFFFDLGSNARGQYLRITEVAGADRSAIILPASALEMFYETVNYFVEAVRGQSDVAVAELPSRPPHSWSEG